MSLQLEPKHERTSLLPHKPTTRLPARDSFLASKTPSTSEPGFPEGFAGLGRFGREDGFVFVKNTDGDVAAFDVFGRLWFEIEEFALLADGELAFGEGRYWGMNGWRHCCEDFLWK